MRKLVILCTLIVLVTVFSLPASAWLICQEKPNYAFQDCQSRCDLQEDRCYSLYRQCVQNFQCVGTAEECQDWPPLCRPDQEYLPCESERESCEDDCYLAYGGPTRQICFEVQ